jgi:hypothetical protein
MSIKHIYIAVGILAVALIGGMALHAYISSERDTAKAEQVKADVQKQIADLRGDLEDTLEAIKKDREQAKTPAQIAQAVPRYTPDIRPILVIPNGVPTQPSSVPVVTLADAPSTLKPGSLVIAASDVPAYWQSVTDCAVDKATLLSCQKEVPLLTKRAEAAETAMKGGSRWNKFKAAGKYIGIGAIIGGGAVLATRR